MVKRWLIITCDNCEAILLADGEKQSRTCDKCDYKNRLYRKGQLRVNVRNSFDKEAEARDALRYMKIPVQERGDVVYQAETWKGEAWGEEFKIFKPGDEFMNKQT